jgi:hypothetical protein
MLYIMSKQNNSIITTFRPHFHSVQAYMTFVEVCYFVFLLSLTASLLVPHPPIHGMSNEPSFQIPLALCFNPFPVPRPKLQQLVGNALPSP